MIFSGTRGPSAARRCRTGDGASRAGVPQIQRNTVTLLRRYGCDLRFCLTVEDGEAEDNDARGRVVTARQKPSWRGRPVVVLSAGQVNHPPAAPSQPSSIFSAPAPDPASADCGRVLAGSLLQVLVDAGRRPAARAHGQDHRRGPGRDAAAGEHALAAGGARLRAGDDAAVAVDSQAVGRARDERVRLGAEGDDDEVGSPW